MTLPKNKPSSRRGAVSKNSVNMGRAAALLIAAAVIALQASSCSDKTPAPPAVAQKSAESTPATQAAPRQRASGVQTGFKDCKQFFAAGTPPIVPKQEMLRELCYDSFAILHSGSTKTPLLVAQRLNKALVADADEKRTNRFFADARLPSAERAQLSDYKKSGYTKGHMAPAGDMPTPAAMAQSFSLANMVPQIAGHNSGPWQKIERDTRHYAGRAKGNVFIITGPVFAHYVQPIGAGQVQVPTHLYKLVYDESTGRAWAHWQENANGVRAGEPISYEALVERIGMELLPGVNPAPRLPL